MYDWARFGSLPRGYSWIIRELAAGRVAPKALVAATLGYGDVGTIRRLGALLEKAGVNGGIVRKLEDALPGSTGTIPHLPRQDPQRLLPAERGSGLRHFDSAERMTDISDDIVTRNARAFA